MRSSHAQPAVTGDKEDTKESLPPPIEIERDIVFGNGGDRELILNLARPPHEPDGPVPAVVVIHGGGWRGGDRGGLHNLILGHLAKRGLVSASISYRFAPKEPFPAQVEDAKCAVRFLRANADEYGIDKEKIGAIGFSAGAHLSMMLGVMDEKDGLEGEGGWPNESSKVQAVAAFFGPTDLSAPDLPDAAVKILDDFLGDKRANVPEQVRLASPITYVDANDAPTLIFHGTKDPLVPVTQAWIMANRMTDAGMPGRIELIVGAGHGWLDENFQRTLDASFDFLEQELKK
jgi:acetyl esterase/lipase